ncbi:MAG: hypothetical protein QOG83_2439 [Alphaproteobacteria bacterium]|nr:hypothetical protein [Alphaproteobacteria bacterium]
MRRDQRQPVDMAIAVGVVGEKEQMLVVSGTCRCAVRNVAGEERRQRLAAACAPGTEFRVGARHHGAAHRLHQRFAGGDGRRLRGIDGKDVHRGQSLVRRRRHEAKAEPAAVADDQRAASGIPKDDLDMAQPPRKPVRVKGVRARSLAVERLRLDPDRCAAPIKPGMPQRVCDGSGRATVGLGAGSPSDAAARPRLRERNRRDGVPAAKAVLRAAVAVDAVVAKHAVVRRRNEKGFIEDFAGAAVDVLEAGNVLSGQGPLDIGLGKRTIRRNFHEDAADAWIGVGKSDAWQRNKADAARDVRRAGIMSDDETLNLRTAGFLFRLVDLPIDNGIHEPLRREVADGLRHVRGALLRDQPEALRIFGGAQIEEEAGRLPIVGKGAELRLRRLTEERDARAAVTPLFEAPRAGAVTLLETVERAADGAGRIASATARSRSRHRAAVAREEVLGFAPAAHLRPRKGRVDAAPERVQPLHQLAKPARLVLAVIEGPGVEAGRVRLEQDRAHDLAHADFRNPARIAADRVEVVVGNEVGGRPRLGLGRRGDVRRIETLQPAEGGVLVVVRFVAPAPAIRACHQRLEQAERRGRPVAGAVVAPVQQAHFDEQRA